MRRPTLLAALLLLATVVAARAGTTPPGINLSWDHCYGDGQVKYKTFACDTNVGIETLVGTFEVDAEMQEISGMDFHLDVRSATSFLPDWWWFKNLGSCRLHSLGAQYALPAGAANCGPWTTPSAVGIGMAAYQPGLTGQNHAHMVGSCSAPLSDLGTLVPNQEYYLFSITINHAKTVGVDACAGCLEPVAIYFSGVEFYSPGVGRVRLLTDAADYSGSKWVSWQSGYPLNATAQCGRTTFGDCWDPYTSFDVVPYDVTRARATSWGLLKSLYR